MDYKAALLSLFVFLSISVLADDMSDAKSRGGASAGAVLGAWGSSEGLSDRGMKPLSTSGSMVSNDGTTFDVQMDCPAPDKFMRVAILPQSSGDIQQIAVSIDTDGNNSYDVNKGFVGPFAAVCVNGVVSCSSGSFNSCQAYQWKGNVNNVELDAVPMDDVGTCYCINNSCGNNLLARNSEKIMSDIGIGIGRVFQAANPRLSLGSGTLVDPATMEYYATESSCMSDKAPEQYFTRMEDLQAAGIAEQSNSSNASYFIANSDVASGHSLEQRTCSIDRVIDVSVVSARDVVQWVYADTPAHQTYCGDGCTQYTLGDNNTNIYGPASCGVASLSQTFKVAHPDKVTSAFIKYGTYDDYLEVTLNGAAKFSDRPTNYSSCERNGGPGINTPVDVTPAFTSSAPNATVDYKQTVWYGVRGGATVTFEINAEDSCEQSNERFVDSCAVHETNSDCLIKDEWVDGVQTVNNYNATGLYPLPSSREITDGSGCSTGVVQRPYWRVERVYGCDTETSTYNYDDLSKRQDEVSGSFDPTTGDFGDTRLDENGSWNSATGNITLPPPDAVECIASCKVRTPMAGSGVSEAGTQAQNNRESIAWDYTFKDCAQGVCPLDTSNPNEQIVDACSCRSEFGQAATFMQLIRMTAQDMVCTQP